MDASMLLYNSEIAFLIKISSFFKNQTKKSYSLLAFSLFQCQTEKSFSISYSFCCFLLQFCQKNNYHQRYLAFYLVPALVKIRRKTKHHWTCHCKDALKLEAGSWKRRSTSKRTKHCFTKVRSSKNACYWYHFSQWNVVQK